MSAPETASVFVVDDHPTFRKGLIDALAEESHLRLVGEAGSGEEAYESLRELQVDVVVLDVTLPGMDGLDLAKLLLARKPQVGIVVLTMHNSEKIFNAAIDLGVHGYLLKDEVVSDVVDAIRRAARGEPYVSPALSGYIMKRGRQIVQFKRDVDGLETLTRAEREVLRRIAMNKSSKEIAAELFISPRTVSTHRTNISTKLGLNGSHSLLSFALLNKSEILSLPE